MLQFAEQRLRGIQFLLGDVNHVLAQFKAAATTLLLWTHLHLFLLTAILFGILPLLWWHFDHLQRFLLRCYGWWVHVGRLHIL